MKFLLAFFLIWTMSYHIYAEKHFEPQKGNVFIIDNFEDGDLAINPRWWIFDKIKVSDQSNNKLEFEYLSSSEKLVSFHDLYFGNELKQKNIQEINIIKKKNNKLNFEQLKLIDD